LHLLATARLHDIPEKPVVKCRFGVAAANSANRLSRRKCRGKCKKQGLGEALVMGSRAAQLAALIFLATHLVGSSAAAVGLCDCCGNRTALTPDCQSACATAKEEIPMCRPAMIYDGDAGRPSGDNALAVGSLKFLSMGRPDRQALERYRQWFERWRSRAEAKFQVTLARCENGEGRDAEFARAQAERDQVLVNYQHGMRRYIEILRAGRAVADVNLGPAAPRLVARVVPARRDVHRSKRVSRQKIAQPKVVQQTLARVAVRTAKVCTGNWVNAACAAP
jgi:hypothetical protein